MTPLAALALATCLSVGAPKDRILAGDLARALPQWGSVAADTPVALAPAPGVQRVFRLAELRRMAAQFQVPDGAEREFCVAQPVAPVSAERVLEAMRKQV